MVKLTNKKRALYLLLTLALIVSLFAGLGATASAAPNAVPYTGQRTQGAYTIETATQLAELARQVNADYAYNGSTFELLLPIDLSQSDTYPGIAIPWTGGTAWTPIGFANLTPHPTTSSPVVGPGSAGFGGAFDGTNKTISHMVTSKNGNAVGLFGYLTPYGSVKQLAVSGSVSVAGAYDAIGGVVGYNSGTISNVIAKVAVTAPNAFNVGGIAGFNDRFYTDDAVGVIVNCANEGDVTGRTKVGGITGQNAGAIRACSNIGDIYATQVGNSGAGGIAGRNGNNNVAVEVGTIDNCYNHGTIDLGNGSWGGGITGFQNALSTVTACYNIGDFVNAHNFHNSIVGNNENPNGTKYNYSIQGLDNTGFDEWEIGDEFLGDEMSDGTAVNLLNTHSGLQPILVWYQDGANPGLCYNAPVPEPPEPPEEPNNFAIVYVGGLNADDDNIGGDDPLQAVATLARAVHIASLSINPAVKIVVLDTVTFTVDAEVFGPQTLFVEWAGPIGEPMFVVATGVSPVDVIIGGLQFDGRGSSATFVVHNASTLAIRNNAVLKYSDIGVDVLAGGFLLANQSQIGGNLYSVRLASVISPTPVAAMAISHSPTQMTEFQGTVFIDTGTFIEIRNALNAPIVIESSNPESGVLIAVGANGYNLTEYDLARFAYYGGGYEFVLDELENTIAIQ